MPASSQVRKAVPIWTAAAPSASVAAIPRPSMMPPDAITGTVTASTGFTPRRHYRIGPHLFQGDGLLDGGGRTEEEHATALDGVDGTGWQQAEREAEDCSATVEGYRELLVERVPPYGRECRWRQAQ